MTYAHPLATHKHLAATLLLTFEGSHCDRIKIDMPDFCFYVRIIERHFALGNIINTAQIYNSSLRLTNYYQKPNIILS